MPSVDVKLCEVTGMEGNNTFLPHEIIINILKRLPVKSLIRFQCVCKNWKNLLKDPLFITDHLHHSNIHLPSLLLPFNGNKTLQLCSFDCDFQLSEVPNAPLIDSRSIVRTWADVRDVKIVGSSNGLLCIQFSDFGHPHTFVLWNPATRELKMVPTTIEFRGNYTIGFGFSKIANDYKIVNIYGYGDFAFGAMCVNGVEVYSLVSGLWKEVEFGILEGLDIYCEAATSNGAVFWVGKKQNDQCPMIVSFDVAMEAFALIPMPNLHPRSTNIPTVYDNKLALLSYCKIETFESCFIHLWVIDEENTWTKKYSGSPYLYPYLLIPQTIWRNEIVCEVEVEAKSVWRTKCKVEMDETKTAEYEEALMEDKERRTLILLNLTTDEFKKFVLNNSGYVGGILNHVESLVPVGSTLKNLDPKS